MTVDWPEPQGYSAADTAGSLSFLTPDRVAAAIREVRSGRVVSLALPLEPGVTPGVELRRVADDLEDAYLDEVTVAPHGFGITHLDAVGHTFHQGRGFGGVAQATAIGPRGLRHGAVTSMLPGIVTRGVLLDVATAFGVGFLERGSGISISMIEEAEAAAGTTVGTGDAVFIRAGIAARLAAERAADVPPREGILAEVVEWLAERRVAVYAGDVIEQLPASGPLAMPLHTMGHVGLGLCLLDNPDLERLREACVREGRSTFLLVCSPLPISGGSGSAVNPLAIF